MRGRKPKPTELKLVEGTFRKDRAPAAPAPATKAGSPHVPEWFDEERIREWKKLVRHYKAEGRSIQPHEVVIHASYIDLVVQLSEAHRELRAIHDEGRRAAKQLSLPSLEHALVGLPPYLADTRREILKRIGGLHEKLKGTAAELGLTPSARSRAGWGTPAPKAPEEQDPWGELAKG